MTCNALPLGIEVNPVKCLRSEKQKDLDSSFALYEIFYAYKSRGETKEPLFGFIRDNATFPQRSLKRSATLDF